MRKLILGFLLALGILGSAGTASAAIVNVSTLVTTWQATGVFLNTGDTLDISAPGLVNWNSCCQTDSNGIDPTTGTAWGPANAGFLVPGTTAFALVGQIGGFLVTEGAYGLGAGFVGSSYSQAANATGQLFLAFNDDIYGDNSGSWPADVTVTPTAVTEPGTLGLLGLAFLALGRRAAKARGA